MKIETDCGFIRSKILAPAVHGFGLAGYSLEDHLNALNIKNVRFFETNQIHTDNIVYLTSKLDSKKIEADAFITNEPGIVCFVRTADCVPILMFDPVINAIAAVHSGWNGTALKIVKKTVEKMSSLFGSMPENICAAIGPSISGQCYEVGADVLQIFHPNTGSKKGFLDLQRINSEILKYAGVSKIEVISICNHCDRRFASYRRDKSENLRQFNFITLSSF